MELRRRFDQTVLMQLFGITLMLSVIIGYSLVLEFGEDHQIAIVRYSLIALFSTLPAIMYFIFIAWRKTSLFQEYISNLYRLGLLSPYRRVSNGNPDGKDEYFDSVRINGYIQRFEGVYGPIDAHISDEIVNAVKNGNDPAATTRSILINSQSAGQIFSLSTSIPVFVATCLFAIGWFLFLPPQEYNGTTQHLSQALAVNPNTPILYGFIGAYFFSLQMLFRRFVTNDLRAKAYIGVSMRIVLSILGAWIIIMALETLYSGTPIEVFTLMAFVVGAFPTVLWRMVRTATSKFSGQWLPHIDSYLPVRELDGLTVWHQARLEEEDIENAFNMANADIIDLLLHTRIPTDRAVDWVDQAILLSCISSSSHDTEETQRYRNDRRLLKQLGIHSASSLSESIGKDGACTELSGARFEALNLPAEQKNLLSSTAAAIHNYTNLKLVRNWKAPTDVLSYPEIVNQTGLGSTQPPKKPELAD
ncbi:MAG: hypothetical protein AAF404_01520 [Pseudomonadota bacterium]